MRFPRRVLLALALAGLSGCAPTPAAPPTTQAPQPRVTPTDATSPTPVPTPTPERESEPQLPSREELEARYADRTPQHWGLDVPGVISRGRTGDVALTLDACGGGSGSGYDEALIEHLRRLTIPATLFLNARWIDANPTVAAELAADPLFELANHGLAHLPLSVSGRQAYGIRGTGSVGEVYDEVMGGAQRLRAITGQWPLWFRSGTAHIDEVAVEITADLGMNTVGFDINGDAGATFTPTQVRRALSATQPGSIIIAHFNRPGSGTAEGMAQALGELLDAGHTFAPLSQQQDVAVFEPR